MDSVRVFYAHSLICCVFAVSFPPVVTAQQLPPNSEERRSTLLAERDAKFDQAKAHANEGKYAEALDLMDQVFEIEQSVIGEPDEELIVTLGYQARFAHAAKYWIREIEFRRRAYQMGQELFQDGDYRRRDLELSLKESQDNAARTEEQRSELAKALAASEQAVASYRAGRYSDAIAFAEQVRAIREKVLGKDHPHYADSLNNLALFGKSIGNHARTEQLYVEAKTIREKVLGKEHPDYAQSLHNLAALYDSMGDYARAERLDVEAKTIREKVLGKDHPEYASSLNSLAALYSELGAYIRAEPLYVEAKAIREKTLGKEHPDYATSVNNLAVLYYSMGAYTRAEPLFVESKAIREKTLGREHPAYATSLNNLAALYDSMGDYARAEQLYVEAKAIREKTLGKEHPDYATSLNNLAALYDSMGDYARAEQLYVEAKAIREKTLGKEHPEYASTLNNLALLYQSMGDYRRAESMHLEAKTIQEKVLGRNNSEYATSLHNLALLYHSMGDYEKAEPLLVEAKEICERVLGKEHPHYADSLNELAKLYFSMGDYARAERLSVEAKIIREKVLGKKHPDYAQSLNNLAVLYYSMRDYARAEPLYLEAKVIREELQEQNHPEYAQCLNNLALLYHSMGDYAQAEPLYLKVNADREKLLGKEHPDYAQSLTNLAALYRSMGRYSLAEPLMLEARTVYEKVLGKEHSNYALSLNNLAALYWSMGDYARAEPLHLEAIDVTLSHLKKMAYIQSEQQQILNSQSIRYRLDNYLQSCVDGHLNPASAIERLVQWKGAILRRGRGLRLAASDSFVADQFRQLQSVASQISVATKSVPEPKHIEAWRKGLDSLSEQQRKLEADLMSRSATFREINKDITFDEIRQSIPVDGVLVDYLEFNGKEGRSLAASVIRREGNPVLLDLGLVVVIGQTIDQWRTSYGRSSQAQAAGSRLRTQIWEPLLKHIDDTELILVSTDGILGRLPLAALPGSKPGTYLIEDHRIASIPVPQLLPDLISEQRSESSDAKKLLLVGDVDYDAAETIKRESESPSVDTLAATRAAYGLTWPKLAETGREVDFIRGLYQQTRRNNEDVVIDLRQHAATEAAFRDQAPKCQLLHLATHGFFAPADKKNALSPEAITASQGSSLQMTMLGPQRQAVIGFSPGQLSGLVFAGANRPPESLGPWSEETESDDGIMTADEIAYLPLDGVELAVLSACETGLGEVAGGEGLIGIQRAFQVSGVDSVLATLWKVDDKMTRALMERFYRNLFEGKMSNLDSLREVQLWVLNNPSLIEASDEDRGNVRKKKEQIEATEKPSERTSPYYWAPFVLSGDWR